MEEKRPICYTVIDIQKILNVSRPVVYALLKKGHFRVLKIGEKYIVPKASFDNWLYGRDEN